MFVFLALVASTLACPFPSDTSASVESWSTGDPSVTFTITVTSQSTFVDVFSSTPRFDFTTAAITCTAGGGFGTTVFGPNGYAATATTLTVDTGFSSQTTGVPATTCTELTITGTPTGAGFGLVDITGNINEGNTASAEDCPFHIPVILNPDELGSTGTLEKCKINTT